MLADSPRIEDGPGWWAARAAIESVKLEAVRPATRQLRTAYRLADETEGPDAAAVNAALMCRDQMIGSVSERSLRLLRGTLAGRTQAELAADEEISAVGGLAAGAPRRAGRDRRDRRAVEEGAMSWIAVLLIGVAVTDLAHSIRPMRLVNECTGAAVAVWAGLIAGLTDSADLVALAVIAGIVVLWGQTVTRAFGHGRAWLPLLVLGAALVVGALTTAWAGTAGGLLGEWLESVQIPALQGLSADRVLLLVGCFLVQLSTGNVVVRLVLAATGTTNPTYGSEPDPEQRLKGGRLLGPMERVFILGLGLAGNLIAASIVIAAKGLLRFPELQSKGEQVRIHRLTEYFLVGSFVSWLVALSSLALLAT